MPASNSKTKKTSSSPSKKTSSVKKSRTNKKPTSKLYRILNRDEDWSGDQSSSKITFEIKKTNNTAVITKQTDNTIKNITNITETMEMRPPSPVPRSGYDIVLFKRNTPNKSQYVFIGGDEIIEFNTHNTEPITGLFITKPLNYGDKMLIILETDNNYYFILEKKRIMKSKINTPSIKEGISTNNIEYQDQLKLEKFFNETSHKRAITEIHSV